MTKTRPDFSPFEGGFPGAGNGNLSVTEARQSERNRENMMVDPVKKTARNQLPAGPGRPKGQQNKLNRELKQMILDALDKAGGVTYLTTQAKANPKAFMSLLGRVLPLQVTGEGGGPIEFAQITRKIVRPDQ